MADDLQQPELYDEVRRMPNWMTMLIAACAYAGGFALSYAYTKREKLKERKRGGHEDRHA